MSRTPPKSRAASRTCRRTSTRPASPASAARAVTLTPADDSAGDEIAPDSITDDQLPEDLRPGDDNPLARPLPEDEGKDVDLGIGETRDDESADQSADQDEDEDADEDSETR